MRSLAVFLPNLPLGGVERQMCALAGGFVEHGIRVDIVLADGTDAVDSLVPESVHLVDLGSRRTASAVPRLTQYLLRRRPNALLAAKDHANVAAVVAATAARRTPVVATVHAQPSAALAAPERWTGHAVRRLLSLTYPRADAVVCVSEGVAQDVREIAPKCAGRIRVIRNPVLTPSFWELATKTPDHPWLRRPRDRPVLVWCGRLGDEKDPLSALEAFALLHDVLPSAMVFVGDGPLADDVRVRARELGVAEDVTVTGFVLDAPAYIRLADALVLSSRREGLPSVLVEALAVGTPVVATDCHAGPREILDGGHLGRLVPVGDVELLSGAMREAVTAPRGIATEDDLREYTGERATEHYLDLLARISAPGSRS